MKHDALDLLFLEQPDDALPGPAISHVCVGSWHKQGYEIPNEPQLLTPQCMGTIELDREIDVLHAQLEEIRKEGHRRYAAVRVRAANT
jgi:hypothetical protein